MCHAPTTLAALCFVALVGFFGPLPAASASDEPLLESLQTHLKQEAFELGMLFQVVGDFQSERRFAGNTGFSVANARVYLKGKLDRRFSYLLQANFVNSPALLDGRISYRHRTALRLDVGQFKAPFSREFLVSASAIDFVNRSQVATALAPGRQIGVQLQGDLGNSWWYGVGIFNGNGIGNNNDDGKFMYSGRTVWQPGGRDTSDWSAGVNLAWSEDTNASLGSTIGGETLFPGFSGSRTLAGVDLRWDPGPWMLDGEWIFGHLDPSDAAAQDLYGFHLSGGYMVSSSVQLLVRFDRLDTDELDLDSDLILFGANWWPSGATELQANLIFPTRDPDLGATQLLLNYQLAF